MLSHSFNKAGQIEKNEFQLRMLLKKTVILFCFPQFIFSEWLFTVKIKDLRAAVQFHKAG